MLEVIKNRRSCRNFSSKEVEDSKIKEIPIVRISHILQIYLEVCYLIGPVAQRKSLRPITEWLQYRDLPGPPTWRITQVVEGAGLENR